MLQIRPYRPEEADRILLWCRDEKAFYQWTAGILGRYPITAGEFSFVESLIPFTAFSRSETVGFFTMRRLPGTPEELRFGFVILSPDLRGKGYGQQMLRLGLKLAFEEYGAKKISLGVFENNLSAYRCYKAVGFSDVFSDFPECYRVLGEEWKCKELIWERGLLSRKEK